MRRLLIAALLLAGLCAPPAVLAQVGTPGVTNPPPTPVFLDTAFKLKGGNFYTSFDARSTSDITVRLPIYSGDFLTTTGNGQSNYYPAVGTYPHIQSLFEPNGAKLLLREDVDDELIGYDLTTSTGNFGYINGGSIAAGVQAYNSGSGSSYASLVGGGMVSVTAFPDGYALIKPSVSQYGSSLTSGLRLMIYGGYNVSGVSSPAQRQATVTVTDTAPSIIAGTVQVCGFTDVFPTQVTKVCESLDFSGGAGAQTTANFYGKIDVVKSSGFNVLGGAGDEKIKVEWATGAVGPVVANTNIVNHTKTLFSSLAGGVAWRTLTRMGCADVLGCDFDAVGPLYGFTTIIVEAGSNTITCVPGALLKLSAAHTLDEYDTLSLVQNPDTSVVMQTSVSVN